MDELRASIPEDVRQQQIIECVNECRQIARDGGDIETFEISIYHLGVFLQYGRDFISEPEPGTGNNLLHLAAQNAQFAVINYIHSQVSSKCWSGQMRFDAKRYALLCKKNNEGNTALHLAVTHPNLDATRSMYSFFQNLWLPHGVDPYKDEEIDPDDPLIPEPWGKGSVPQMMTLLFMKNNAGRDVIAEARFAGQKKNAAWCEKALRALDPKMEWQSPETIARIAEEVFEENKKSLEE